MTQPVSRRGERVESIDHEPDAGEALAIADATLTIKIGGASSGGRLSLLEGRFMPGGFAPVPHIHGEAHESFYVLEGRFAFRIGDHRFERGEGAVIHVPPGLLHGFTNAGSGPGRLLVLHTPPLDAFFREMAALAADGPMDRTALAELMRAWDMTIPQPPAQ